MLTPIIFFLVCKGALGPVLYRKTMNTGWLDILGASLASLGLSHSIARGVLMGLTQKKGVFKVTAKGKSAGSKLNFFEPIREEFLLLVALIVCSAVMLGLRGFDNLDTQLWVSMLALQSLPYWSALACQIIANLPENAPTPAPQVVPEPAGFD
jgi:hypothetical protein